jgi:uroporphyrinogen-III synthase
VAEAAAKALAGKRVVVTRAAEQSESLLTALREQHAIPITLPLVAFAPPEDLRPLDDTIRNFGRYDWVFLTSQNALRALQERSDFLGLQLAKILMEVSVAAVGPATAESARNAGLKVAYVATRHQGVALAEELAAQVKGKRVLLPRSDRASRDLVDTLNRVGAFVSEVTAYTTVATSEQETRSHEAVLREGADAVLFFSPSAVHHFFDFLGRARFLTLSQEAAFTAIGPVTKGALREAGATRIVVARDTTVAAIVAALGEFFAKPHQSLPAGVKPE